MGMEQHTKRTPQTDPDKPRAFGIYGEKIDGYNNVDFEYENRIQGLVTNVDRLTQEDLQSVMLAVKLVDPANYKNTKESLLRGDGLAPEDQGLLQKITEIFQQLDDGSREFEALFKTLKPTTEQSPIEDPRPYQLLADVFRKQLENIQLNEAEAKEYFQGLITDFTTEVKMVREDLGITLSDQEIDERLNGIVVQLIDANKVGGDMNGLGEYLDSSHLIKIKAAYVQKDFTKLKVVLTHELYHALSEKTEDAAAGDEDTRAQRIGLMLRSKKRQYNDMGTPYTNETPSLLGWLNEATVERLTRQHFAALAKKETRSPSMKDMSPGEIAGLFTAEPYAYVFERVLAMHVFYGNSADQQGDANQRIDAKLAVSALLESDHDKARLPAGRTMFEEMTDAIARKFDAGFLERLEKVILGDRVGQEDIKRGVDYVRSGQWKQSS